MRTRVCSAQDAAALIECVDQEIAAGLRPTIAVVFSSVAQDFNGLGSAFDERGMAVVGSTTSGEIANADLLEESCAALLMDMDPSAFAIDLQSRAQNETMADVARRLGKSAVGRFANPAVLVFGSGLKTNGEEVVAGVREGAGRAVPLYGGMAGDDLKMQSSHVFNGTSASDDGLLGLVLDGDRFRVEGIATNGWQAVGVEKTVTHSAGNVVFTIDGEPALDVYRKYMNLPELKPEQHVDIVRALGVQFPLSVKRADGSVVIRAPLLYDAEHDALIFAGGVPQGAKVKFCIPPSLDIVERVVDEASAVKEAVPEADALILIACIARRIALGPLAEEEVRGLYDLWNAPMLGFFSYGEIGSRTPDDCDFHTETCTMVALREISA